MSRNLVIGAIAVVLILLAALIIYRASRPPVKPLTPEEWEILKRPGPASPVGGGVGGER